MYPVRSVGSLCSIFSTWLSASLYDETTNLNWGAVILTLVSAQRGSRFVIRLSRCCCCYYFCCCKHWRNSNKEKERFGVTPLVVNPKSRRPTQNPPVPFVCYGYTYTFRGNSYTNSTNKPWTAKFQARAHLEVYKASRSILGCWVASCHRFALRLSCKRCSVG